MRHRGGRTHRLTQKLTERHKQVEYIRRQTPYFLNPKF